MVSQKKTKTRNYQRKANTNDVILIFICYLPMVNCLIYLFEVMKPQK